MRSSRIVLVNVLVTLGVLLCAITQTEAKPIPSACFNGGVTVFYPRVDGETAWWFKCNCSFNTFGDQCEYTDVPPPVTRIYDGLYVVRTNFSYWKPLDGGADISHVDDFRIKDQTPCRSRSPSHVNCDYSYVHGPNQGQPSRVLLTAGLPVDPTWAIISVYVRLSLMKAGGVQSTTPTPSIALAIVDSVNPTSVQEIGTPWVPNNYSSWDECNGLDCYKLNEHTFNLTDYLALTAPRYIMLIDKSGGLVWPIIPLTPNRIWVTTLAVQKWMGPCYYHPCLNGGSCVEYSNLPIYDPPYLYKCACPFNYYGRLCQNRDAPSPPPQGTTIAVSTGQGSWKLYLQGVEQSTDRYTFHVADYKRTDTAPICQGPSTSLTHENCDYDGVRTGEEDYYVLMRLTTVIPATRPLSSAIANVTVRLSLLWQTDNNAYFTSVPQVSLTLVHESGTPATNFDLWYPDNVPSWDTCNTLDCYAVKEHTFKRNGDPLITDEDLYVALTVHNSKRLLVWPFSPITPNRIWVNIVPV